MQHESAKRQPPIALSQYPLDGSNDFSLLKRDAVGKPVARLPPHRSLREVFPHKAPRLDSLPCQVSPRISVTDIRRDWQHVSSS